jgi:hypothetical protein
LALVVGDRDGDSDMADDLPMFLGHDGKRQFIGARKARTMNCSVWLVCGASAKAAVVTASMAAMSSGASS